MNTEESESRGLAYVPLVDPMDTPRIVQLSTDQDDSSIELVTYPDKKMDSVGMGHVMLARTSNEYAAAQEWGDGKMTAPVLIIDKDGAREGTLREAIEAGLGNFQVEIERPIGTYMDTSMTGKISLDGMRDAIAFPTHRGESDKPLEGHKGTRWGSMGFFLPGEDMSKKGKDLFAPHDSSGLSNLKFKFELRQHMPKNGGDVN